MAAGKLKQAKLVEAFAHPLRIKILVALEAGPASPSELASRLGEPLHAVGYHMRRLVELGSIELAEERVLRGTIEHIYRLIERAFFDDEQAAQMAPEEREETYRMTLHAVWRDVLAGLEHGGFGRRPDVHVSRSPLVFDEQGWEEVVARLAALLNDAHEISAASLARMESAEGADEPIKARLMMLLFEAADPA